MATIRNCRKRTIPALVQKAYAISRKTFAETYRCPRQRPRRVGANATSRRPESGQRGLVLPYGGHRGRSRPGEPRDRTVHQLIDCPARPSRGGAECHQRPDLIPIPDPVTRVSINHPGELSSEWFRSGTTRVMMSRSSNRSVCGDPRILTWRAVRATPVHLKESNMAVQATPPAQVAVDYDAYAADDERGYGWVAFAGTLLLMLGHPELHRGSRRDRQLALLRAQHPLHRRQPEHVGLDRPVHRRLEWAVGVGVFVKNQFSRWTGVIVSGLNCDRAAADDPRVPVLVTVDLHARHPGDLRSDRLRPADLQRRLSTRKSASPPSGVRKCSSVQEDTRPLGENPRVADASDAGTDEATLQQTQRLMEWRRSAQRVTRAWNAWLAAESRDRGVRYRALRRCPCGRGKGSRGARAHDRPRRSGALRHCIDARKSGLGAR